MLSRLYVENSRLRRERDIRVLRALELLFDSFITSLSMLCESAQQRSSGTPPTPALLASICKLAATYIVACLLNDEI